MGTVECPNCGQQVEIDSLDEPPRFVEHPADKHHPRWLVIIGGHSQWLLHRCEITETRHDD
jgi:hypothetical protein